MYSIKRKHPKLLDVPDGEPQPFLAVGEPYQDKSELPERWKGKRLVCGGAYQNTFSKLEYPEGEPYVAAPKYIEAEPLDCRRKAGFGSHDASKRDEFTSFIRTEQYREMVRKEQGLLETSQRRQQQQQQQIYGDGDKDSDLTNAIGDRGKTFLYDIGRNRTTPFDPKLRRDRYYHPSAPANDGKPRFGPYRLSSEEIGNGMWQVKSMPPRFAPASCHNAFMDKSHLKTGL